MLFADRFDAGKQLAQALAEYADRKNVVILGIPRGGVEIGYIVAKELKAALDIVVTKKIGFPGNPEAAIGAVAPDGKVSIDKSWIDYSGISKKYIDSEVKAIKEEIKRRYQNYRGRAAIPKLNGKTVILIDDGIATGQTVRATAEYLKRQKCKRLILAVPVSPKDTVEDLKRVFDEVICLQTPLVFYAIGQFYGNFEQISDEKVKAYLEKIKKKKK
jgi:putative phosphoribosyl transferase